jgi:hypothetical protein
MKWRKLKDRPDKSGMYICKTTFGIKELEYYDKYDDFIIHGRPADRAIVIEWLDESEQLPPGTITREELLNSPEYWKAFYELEVYKNSQLTSSVPSDEEIQKMAVEDNEVFYIMASGNEYAIQDYVRGSNQMRDRLAPMIAKLEEEIKTLKTQNRAYKTLQESMDKTRAYYSKQAQDVTGAIKTLDSERDMNSVLTEENDILRSQIQEYKQKYGKL